MIFLAFPTLSIVLVAISLGEAQGNSAICGKDFTNVADGTFTSPGYPNTFELTRSVWCEWKIIVAEGKKIQFKVEELQVPNQHG